MSEKNDKRENANAMLGAGAGLAVFGAGSAALIGATCPLCVIAAPVLIGAGIVGRIRAGRIADKTDSSPAEQIPNTEITE